MQQYTTKGMNIEINLIITPTNDELFQEWKNAINKVIPPPLRNRLHFVRAKLDDLPGTRFDAIVSPANSYGRMGESSSENEAFFVGKRPRKIVVLGTTS